MPTILLTNHYKPEVLKVVTGLVPKGFDFISLDKVSKSELIAKAPLAEYFLASGRLPIDAEVINAAVKLKMVQRTGVGTDGLDLALLKQKNIPVYVNKGVNAVSVAEHTVMFMLAALRKLPQIDAKVKSGIWQKNEHGLKCHSLQGKTVGLIGLGNIGMEVARMLQAFQVHILYFDKQRLDQENETKLRLAFSSLDDLLRQADIISLHCALNEKTRKLIGQKEFNMMKKGAFLVNTARGQIVDEVALVEALQAGQLAGVALDVFESEPVNLDSPLLKLDNVVLSSHVGGLTLETFSSMIEQAFSNIVSFEDGGLQEIADKLLNY